MNFTMVTGRNSRGIVFSKEMETRIPCKTYGTIEVEGESAGVLLLSASVGVAS